MMDSFSIDARLPIASYVDCLLDAIGAFEAWDPQAVTAMIRGTLQQKSCRWSSSTSTQGQRALIPHIRE